MNTGAREMREELAAKAVDAVAVVERAQALTNELAAALSELDNEDAGDTRRALARLGLKHCREIADVLHDLYHLTKREAV